MMPNRTPHFILTFAMVSIAAFCMAPLADAQPKSPETVPANSSKSEEVLELPDLPAASSAPVPTKPGGASPGSSSVGAALPALAPPVSVSPPTPIISAPQNVAIKPPPPLVNVPAPVSANPPAMSTAAQAAAGTHPPDVNARTADYDANMTLMFSGDDMYKVTQMLKLYDSYEEHKQGEAPQKDNLSDLFSSQPPAGEISPVPNLYMGSIVYYSSGNWYVSLNGRIITSAGNAPGKEFYVSKISRKQAEIVWKPAAMEQVYDIWNQVTGDGKNLPDNIALDRANGAIILQMRPNQTFVIRALAIREGLIKPDSLNEKAKEITSPSH